MVQAPQRGCGCPIHADIQGQVEWSPRYPDLVIGNLALPTGRGWYYLVITVPSILILLILWYYYNSIPLVIPLVSSFPIVFFVVCAGFALANNETIPSTCSSSLQWDGGTRYEKHESLWVKIKIGSLCNTYCCRKKKNQNLQHRENLLVIKTNI